MLYLICEIYNVDSLLSVLVEVAVDGDCILCRLFLAIVTSE
jgi:hypothetical protein